MTLGGMLTHLAYYEDHWFSHRMRGNDRQAVWSDDYWDDSGLGVELGHRGLPPEAAHPLAGRGVPLRRSALRDPGGRRP